MQARISQKENSVIMRNLRMLFLYEDEIPLNYYDFFKFFPPFNGTRIVKQFKPISSL